MTARNATVLPLIRWVKEQGCEVTLSGANHYKVTYQGHMVGTLGITTRTRGSSGLNAKTFIQRNLRRLQENGTTLR